MSKRTSLEVKQEAGIYTIWQDGRQLPALLPGTLAWCSWLDEYAIASFGFTPQAGAHYTARREQRQRGGNYWYAYRKQGQRLRKLYVGRSVELTIARLEQIAAQLADVPDPAHPEPERATLVPFQPVIAISSAQRSSSATARGRAQAEASEPQQKPKTPHPEMELERQYALLLGQALSYRSLLAAVAGSVPVDAGEANWQSFFAGADPLAVAQATSQALHLCHMLDITPPVLPGQETLSWCATVRERYNGWHGHRQPGTYQDRRGNYWCEACFARYEIMEAGESLGYPPTVSLDTTLFMRIGYEGWLYFVQYAGNEAVFLVHRLVRRMHDAWKRGTPITACEHQPCRRTVYYQDFTGHSWCENHVLCFSIMRMGTALDYPALLEMNIEAGEDAWLTCVQNEKREKMEGVLKHVRKLLEEAERPVNGSAEPLTQPFQAPKKNTEYRVVEFAPIDGKRDTREQSQITIHAGDTVEGVKEAIHLYWSVGQRKPYAELRLYRRGKRIYEYELKSDGPKE